MGVTVDLPELIRLRGLAKRIAQLTPGAASGLFSQAYLSLFRGRGLDFDSVRTYQPGDDFRSLDWRVTARTGRLHTKLFHEEREHTLFLALDVSPAMRFGTKNAFKIVTAARAAAVLAWLAIENGDRVGLMLFGGGPAPVERAPESGEQGVIACLKLLADATSAPPSDGDSASLTDGLRRLRRHAKPGCLVVVLADMAAFDGEARRQLARFSRDGDAAILLASDPLERELPPPGFYNFSLGEGVVGIDSSSPSTRAAFAADFLAREAELGDWARGQRIRHANLGTEAPLFEALRDGLFKQKRLANG
jgi:uncharacterized protein (DUF58 family)